MRPNGPRDPLAGPDSGPAPPFPLQFSGKVIKGFGRGSKELGIPTANIPLSGVKIAGKELDSGIYFGWAGLDLPPSSASSSTSSSAAPQTNSSTATNGAENIKGSTSQERGSVYPMVMSVGWNPYYKNSVRSVEIHIMHTFPTDFYGHHLNILILGFIRPEYDYVSLDSLVEDIRTDIDVSRRSLERPAYRALREDPFLRTFPDVDGLERAESQEVVAQSGQ